MTIAIHRDTCQKMLSQADGHVSSYAIELFSYEPETTRGLSRHQDIYLPFNSFNSSAVLA